MNMPIKRVGRVIAIRPVATRIEATKWQKRAFLMTIWVFEPRARVPVHVRILLVRLWYACRIRYASIEARVHPDG